MTAYTYVTLSLSKGNNNACFDRLNMTNHNVWYLLPLVIAMQNFDGTKVDVLYRT